MKCESFGLIGRYNQLRERGFPFSNVDFVQNTIKNEDLWDKIETNKGNRWNWICQNLHRLLEI